MSSKVAKGPPNNQHCDYLNTVGGNLFQFKSLNVGMMNNDYYLREISPIKFTMEKFNIFKEPPQSILQEILL